jgi:hypothetical protein
MGPHRTTLAAAALLALAAPAAAEGCRERTDALAGRIDQEGREAVSASTSGKETGARREAKGADGAPQTGGGPEAQAERAAEDAGAGGLGAQQAKARLNDARVALGKGDEARCAELAAEAERLLSQPR